MAGVVRIRRGLIAAAVAVAMLGFAAPAMANVLYVDPAGSDTTTCQDPTHPCQTIGYTISQAAAGDEVRAAAGTYPEPTVNVDRTVHLVGAAAGIDARGRNAAESEVSHGFSVSSGVSGVSIDGFFLHGDGASTNTNGILLPQGPQSGFRIVNNIITGFDLGIVLNTGGSATIVRHNDIHDNNTGPGQTGIICILGLSNAQIDANRIANQTRNAVAVEGPYSSDLSITNNTISASGPVVLNDVHGGTISGNTITGGSRQSIYLAGDNSDFDLRGNTVSGSAGAAIALDDTPDQSPAAGVSLISPSGPNSGISVLGNDLSGNTGGGIRVTQHALATSGGTAAALPANFNRIVGNTGFGISNDSPGAVDATNNWWGCNNGPNQSGCDKTAGSGTVTTDPYLVLTATAERGRILTNGDTNRVTGGFGFNSKAQVVDPSAFPPTLLAFTASLGTVSPIFVKTSGGVAQTLYTAGSTAGNGSVTAHADQGQATTSPFVVSSQAGPQGPQGPPGSAAQPNPVLILSNSLRATKQRIVSVSISCPTAAGLCDGRLGIGAGSATLGNVSFLVQGGSKAVIRVPFTKSGVRRAIRRKRVTVVVLSRDNAGTAALTTKVVQFRR